jgi:cytochrome P450
MSTIRQSDDDVPFLDSSDPDFSIRSEAVLQARKMSWWARTPYGLAVLRYEEMKQMINHPLLRQGSYRWPEHNQAGGVWAQWWKRMMLNREGADHARLRKLGAPAFAPRLVAGMIPKFQALADDLIRDFEADGKCEFMKRFAEPYATRVVCELVGVSHQQWQEFAELAVTMGLALGVTYARDEARINAATERFFAIAEQIIADRRREPRDDFISALINANENKDTLNDQELSDMIVLSIFGGIDTTRSQIGLAMAMFIEHPDQWTLLGDNPDLARPAVEEVMRLRPTTTWVTREATEDFEFKGVPIVKGTTIHLFSSAAASDPEHFTPGFDITVQRKPHFGFGGGRHHCIGSQIARGDMTEALRLLAQRLKNPVYDGEPQWLPDSGNTGPVSLPMAFDAVSTG